jgi:hypothetical protein
LNLINISSLPLATGNSFQVFSAANYSGSFSGITPTTPGAGLAWDISHLNGGKINVVTAGAAQPVIGGTTLSGGNLIFNGTGGTANGIYYVLTSTNLTAPLVDWSPVATNAFDASGDFSFTNAVSSALHQQFYLIKQP